MNVEVVENLVDFNRALSVLHRHEFYRRLNFKPEQQAYGCASQSWDRCYILQRIRTLELYAKYTVQNGMTTVYWKIADVSEVFIATCS